MKILSIDTASSLCACALLSDDSVVTEISDDIGKGHAEHINGQIATLLKEADWRFDDIAKVAVNIGPGSFTGIRIGVACARALALALEIPVYGVTSLDALFFEVEPLFQNRPVMVLIDAFEGSYYAKGFAATGQEILAPCVLSHQELDQCLEDDMVVVGNHLADLVSGVEAQNISFYKKGHPDVASFAKLARRQDVRRPPNPLYIRPANAKPSKTV